MDCGTVRDRLVRGERDAAMDSHQEACGSCAVFARRLEAAREAFRQPAAWIEPDPGFASRVAARLPRPAEVLGWAALRALPAALVLALALAWLGLSQPPSADFLLTEDPSLDLLLTYDTLAAGMRR